MGMCSRNLDSWPGGSEIKCPTKVPLQIDAINSGELRHLRARELFCNVGDWFRIGENIFQIIEIKKVRTVVWGEECDRFQYDIEWVDGSAKEPESIENGIRKHMI